MKLKKGFTNIILSLILVGAFALAGFGAELIPPLWDDFCPDGLENAEYKEINDSSHRLSFSRETMRDWDVDLNWKPQNE